ncbi:hypothetical protein [Micromonospora sp. CB01531]|nr:hypothetical protein [Micromonospora sp. CB01531]
MSAGATLVALTMKWSPRSTARVSWAHRPGIDDVVTQIHEVGA